ncbi:MAG: lipopolysaccharide transport periplasmic protein LptA [Steroidobacterales bacterium]
MAASIHKALGLIATLSVLVAAPGAAFTPTQEPIQLDAQSSELDYGNNQLLFRKVKISQGAMSVAADQARATGLDFENSHWVFQGNVRIVMEQGQLSSDEADVTFEKKLLSKALITGKQAQFEQHNAASGKPVQGRADTIDYNISKGIVRLSGGAWLSDGQNEIRGESLKYNVAERKMIAESAEQNSQRVHITITPPPANPKP